MRNKFVYSCSTKIMLQDSMNFGTHFVHPAGCGSVFPAKQKLLRCLKKWFSVGERSSEYGR